MEHCTCWGQLQSLRRLDGAWELVWHFGLEATPAPPWPWLSDPAYFEPHRKRQRLALQPRPRLCRERVERQRALNRWLRSLSRSVCGSSAGLFRVRRWLKKFRGPLLQNLRTNVDPKITYGALQYVWLLGNGFQDVNHRLTFEDVSEWQASTTAASGAPSASASAART